MLSLLSKKIKNTLDTKEKTVFLELDLENLVNILENEKDKHVIIKFGAEWCAPCKKIEPVLDECFLEMPDNVYCFNLDVDDNIEIFGKLKTKKSVKNIPVILYYDCRKEREKWFVSDKNISDSDPQKIMKFFEEIYKNL
tara:strand:+ start:860 stop:1276 length:417 start_codon:yes stop_codon:yes gene_type:complete